MSALEQPKTSVTEMQVEDPDADGLGYQARRTHRTVGRYARCALGAAARRQMDARENEVAGAIAC
jgi:hypothetical protein